MIKVFRSLAAWQRYRAEMNDRVMTIGFVPTMGHCHAGHVSLFERSVAENDFSIASIFVNPTQFNHPDDLKKYPRTLEADLEKLESAGVDAVLVPPIQEMYPLEYRFQLKEVKESLQLEGEHRPGHFDGVLTVVLKLFHLVRPHRAYFGEKDYQQYALIADMVKAFFIPVEVLSAPTIRDEEGLALSSRNTLLSPEGLLKARQFARLLAALEGEAADQKKILEQAGFRVDYLKDHEGRRYAAVWVEGVRLIDNICLERGAIC